MRWFWGSLLLLLGIIFLGFNLGWWTVVNFANLWHFWPIVLILFGISLIFRQWRFGWLIVLIAFLLFAALVVGALLPATNGRFYKQNASVKTSDFSEGMPQNITSAEFNIKTGASSVTLSSSGDKLIEGTLKSVQNPELQVNIENQKAVINLDLSKPVNVFNFTKNVLDIKLTKQVPITINIDSGASSLDLELTDLNISGLKIKTGATSLKMKLGEKIKNDTEIDIDAGASSLDLSLPKSLGAKINFKTGVTSKNLNGFDKIDETTYQSQDYDKSTNKIHLQISAGASSININRY